MAAIMQVGCRAGMCKCNLEAFTHGMQAALAYNSSFGVQAVLKAQVAQLVSVKGGQATAVHGHLSHCAGLQA